MLNGAAGLEMMKAELESIKRAYDLAAAKYRAGIDPLKELPREFAASSEFKAFLADAARGQSNTNAPSNREFLDPRPGMNFLNAGCCADLAAYRLDRWPSLYFGVDLSPEIIKAMREFVIREKIAVGGLEVAEVAELPFADDFFDLASLIGVLAYFDLDYASRALAELCRALKPGGRLVVDIPNPDHPHLQTMFRFEALLGMTNVPKSRAEFEKALRSKFRVVKGDDSQVTLRYFVEAVK